MEKPIRFSGFLFCYQSQEELNEIYNRIKDEEIPNATVRRGLNQNDVPYPWTLAIICPHGKIKELDEVLCTGLSHFNFGAADSYCGEERIQDFFKMIPLDGKYEPGVAKIRALKCPRHTVHPISCMFCPYGHMLACHYPMTCEEAECEHYQQEMDE